MNIILILIEAIAMIWIVLYTWSFATWLRTQKMPGVWPTRFLAIISIVIPIAVRWYKSRS